MIVLDKGFVNKSIVWSAQWGLKSYQSERLAGKLLFMLNHPSTDCVCRVGLFLLGRFRHSGIIEEHNIQKGYHVLFDQYRKQSTEGIVANMSDGQFLFNPLLHNSFLFWDYFRFFWLDIISFHQMFPKVRCLPQQIPNGVILMSILSLLHLFPWLIGKDINYFSEKILFLPESKKHAWEYWSWTRIAIGLTTDFNFI